MKKQVDSFKAFSQKLGKGMHVEWKETKEIPSLLLRKEYKKVGVQVLDICKMAGLGIVWVIPGGAVITAFIVKFCYRMRPSAFQPEEKEY
jgi:hypothetical protein